MNNNQGRRRVRRAQKKSQISRILLMICMMALVAVISIGGTIAWLTDESTEVKNTFTTSDIDISLKETPVDESGKKNGTLTEGQDNSYRLIPGMEYDKDPTVAVEATTDVDVYLFVEHIETNNVYGDGQKLEYTTTFEADGWTQGDGKNIPANVWYRTVGVNDGTKSWLLITGGKITVNDELTKDVTKDEDQMPSIQFNAYAIQQANGTGTTFTAAEAWDQVKPATANP